MKAKTQDKGKTKEKFERPLMKNKEARGEKKESNRRDSPEVKAILAKINAATAFITKQQESLAKQREKIFEYKTIFIFAITDAKANKKSLESISADIERMKKEKSKLADNTEFEKKKAEAIAKLNAKKDEMRAFLPKFYFGKNKDPEEVAMDYLDALEKEKGKYEMTDYHDEKQERANTRKIAEIDSKRRLAIEYIDLFQEMKSSFYNPATSKQEFIEFTIARAYENMDRLMDKQKVYLHKAEENSKFAKEALEKLEKDKAELTAKVKELQDLRLQLSKQKYQEQQKRIEEMKKREAAELERQKKFEEEKKAFDSKKPYEDEIEKCSALISYLAQYSLPKEGEKKEAAPAKKEEQEKPAATPAPQKNSAVAEATIKIGKAPIVEVSKKKRNTKAKKPAVDKAKQTINHSMDIFGKFAAIGVTCPLIRGDVNDTIEQLRAQKALFQKKSDEEMKSREEKAAAEKKEEEPKAEEKKEEEPKAEENKETTA